MKIVITGGAGFIGSHLSDFYASKGDEVVCIDDFSSGTISNIRHLLDCKNFKLIKRDIRDREIREWLEGADAVFHLAAQIHVDQSYFEPERTYDINVMGTQKILELCREKEVPKIIFASSSEVYGSAQYVPIDEIHPLEAPHPYGASKIAGDRMCHAYKTTYGMNIAIVRCFNIFGPRQKDIGYGGVISIFTRRLMSGRPPIIYGSGNQTRDYTYISDAVDAYNKVLEYGGVTPPLNFGTGQEISINAIAEEIKNILGLKLENVHEKRRIGEVNRLICDSSKAREILGWAPKWPFLSGLKEYVSWYKKYGGV